MKRDLSDKTKALIYKWKEEGDKEAREKIIAENEPLVHSIIKRFKGRLDYEDLFQLGMIGLIKAVDRFDPKKNVKFSTYAVPLIIGEIKMFLRDNTPVKFSRSTKELGKKVKKMEEQLAKYFNRHPTLKEVARELNISNEEVVAALESEQLPVSLESKLEDKNEEKTLKEKIFLDDSIEKEEDKLTVLELLEGLDYKEKSLIIMRYFEEKSQSKVGEYFRLNQVQISRWERKVLKKLREAALKEIY